MIALLAMLVMSPADAKKRRAVEPAPPQRPAVSAPILVEELTPGSLWSEVPARRLVGLDGSARRVGDLITVEISERTATALDATTSTNKSSESSANIGALLGAEQRILAARPGMQGQIQISGGSETSHNGGGNTSRGSAIRATLTCEVVEVMPNGNLHVWGYKQVRVNREVQYVVLDGIARPRDIRMNNTVPSDLLAQATIDVTGTGVVADKQGPGMGQRALDRLWPF